MKEWKNVRFSEEEFDYANAVGVSGSILDEDGSRILSNAYRCDLRRLVSPAKRGPAVRIECATLDLAIVCTTGYANRNPRVEMVQGDDGDDYVYVVTMDGALEEPAKYENVPQEEAVAQGRECLDHWLDTICRAADRLRGLTWIEAPVTIKEGDHDD